MLAFHLLTYRDGEVYLHHSLLLLLIFMALAGMASGGR